MRRVKLTPAQYIFLQDLAEGAVAFSILFKDKRVVIIGLSDDDADAIRERALDYLDVHGFDADYELTELGQLAEELADALYA